MKKASIAFLSILLVFLVSSCAKVEVLPESQNAMLPLAVGNQWVYVDSFFVTSSLPGLDTLVTETTYDVTRKRWIDLFVDKGKPTKTLQRWQGWEVTNTATRFPTTLIWKDDTLFSTGVPLLFNFGSSTICSRVVGELEQNAPFIMTTSYDGLQVAMYANPGIGDSLVYVPAFHDLRECVNDLGPRNYQGIRYKVIFRPLVATATPVMVTTPAGTFTCTDFGSQLWAPGIGMVQSYQEGEAEFGDNNGMLQTAILQWKRVLKSYQLN